MARAASSIQAEIDTLEAYLASAASTAAGVQSRGTSITRANRAETASRLDQLYQDLGRANGTAPMFVRGVVTGLRST